MEASTSKKRQEIEASPEMEAPNTKKTKVKRGTSAPIPSTPAVVAKSSYSEELVEKHSADEGRTTFLTEWRNICDVSTIWVWWNCRGLLWITLGNSFIGQSTRDSFRWADSRVELGQAALRTRAIQTICEEGSGKKRRIRTQNSYEMSPSRLNL